MIATSSFAILLAAFLTAASADNDYADHNGQTLPPSTPIATLLNNIGGQAPQIVGPAVSRLRATHERTIDLREDYLHLIESIGTLPKTFIDNLIPENASPAVGPDGRQVVSVPQVVSAVLGPVRFLSDLLTLPSQLIVRPANLLLEVERNLLGTTEFVEPILEGASAAITQTQQARIQHRSGGNVVPAQVPIYSGAQSRRADAVTTGSLRQGYQTIGRDDNEVASVTAAIPPVSSGAVPTLTEEFRAELKKKIYEAWSKSLLENLSGNKRTTSMSGEDGVMEEESSASESASSSSVLRATPAGSS